MRIPIGAVISLIFIALISWFMFSGKKHIGGPYYKESGDIYVDVTTGQEFATRYNKLIGADEKSFEYLSGAYAKDKNVVFYRGMDFKADPQSFKCISLNTIECSDYGKDKDSVYYTINKISADVNSFELVIGSTDFWNLYGKDKDNVYLRGNKLMGANPPSFKILSGDYQSYAGDSSHVFYGEKIISNSGVENFKIINKFFAKDDKNVYCGGRVVNDADPLSFEILNGGYYKDRQHIFYGDCEFQDHFLSLIKDADAETFKVVSDTEAIDKNHSYDGARRVKIK